MNDVDLDAVCDDVLGDNGEHAGCPGCTYVMGAAVAFGLMGMAEAIREIDRVRACPHCGTASASRCYCDCTMCGPAVCLYWICRTCFDAGRGYDATSVA